MSDIIQLAPIALGEDTWHEPDDAVFQPPLGKRRSPFSVRQAQNVDIDDGGYPSRRDGFANWLAQINGRSAISHAGKLLVQDGDTVYDINVANKTRAPFITGFDPGAFVTFYAHAGQVFYTDGSITGRILANGTPTNWGCSVPLKPTVAAVAGSLRAGRYMVVAMFVDANEVEHAASEEEIITLADNQDLLVSLSALDPDATGIKWYVTEANGEDFYCVAQASASLGTTQISAVESSFEPARTLHLSPPVPADGIFSYKGMLMLHIENFVFPSLGDNHHLYEIAEAQEGFPTTVKGGVGLKAGFWVAGERGAFWVTGGAPENWNKDQIDDRRYAARGFKVPGRYIPRLETSDEVAVFVSEDGPVVGMPSGALFPLTQDRIKLDVVGKRASVILCETTTGIRQIHWSLGD